MSISCTQVSKQYGSVIALQNVSISCKAGEICGIVGANGAGKTTLFKILIGLVTPDNGSVTIENTGKKKAGGIIEKPALYEYLTAYENLIVFAKMQGANTDKNILHQFLKRVGLTIDRKDPVRNYSKGMKQRLGIAIALLNNPSCLILDEPFSGLDPMGIESLRNLILKLSEENLTILISSHIVDVLSKLCSKLYVINNGSIVNSGETAVLISKNTNAYTICGFGIATSKALQNFNTEKRGNCVRVSVSSKEIPKVLQQLAEEQISITSCTPEVDLQQLFHPISQ
tara:strand:+ start:208 stop:1062 length:855 start_codon:yes stop_codon:yes gene_type:complete